jgi:hypothetical protein
MERFEVMVFQKNKTDHSQFQEKDISKILERMKLSNQNGAN